jgi:hypothetical protein
MSLLTEMLSDGYLIAAFLYFSAWSRTLIRDGVSRSYSLIYFGGVAVIILLFWITYSVIRTQGVEPVETEPDSFDQ